MPAGTDTPYVTIVIKYQIIAKIKRSFPRKNTPSELKSNFMHSTSVLKKSVANVLLDFSSQFQFI